MWIIVVVALVVVVALLVYFLRAQHPENAAGHAEPDRHGAKNFREDNGRPAGPGAEADGVAGPGQPVPGPSADDLTAGLPRMDPRADG